MKELTALQLARPKVKYVKVGRQRRRVSTQSSVRERRPYEVERARYLVALACLNTRLLLAARSRRVRRTPGPAEANTARTDPRDVLRALAGLVAQQLASTDAPSRPAVEANASGLLRVKEVARRLRRHVDTVREDLRAGRLHGTKIGRSWRVSAQELEELLRTEGEAKRQERRRVALALERQRERAALARRRSGA